MQSRTTLRLVLPALGLMFLVSITAPAYSSPANGGGAETGERAQSAQPEPSETVDTSLLAGATWVLLLPLVLLAKLKMSKDRRIAWLSSHPGLDAHQIAAYLEDYRLDPESQFPR